MKEGQKLFVTANYAFNYDSSPFEHVVQFDILTQFFEHRNNLEGFVSDEEGDRIEEYSEVSVLVDSLYEAFDNKDIPKMVKNTLLEYEMYEILAEYESPLEGEALIYKEQLITGNYEN